MLLTSTIYSNNLLEEEEEEEEEHENHEQVVEVEDVDEEEANQQPQQLARELWGLEPYNAPGHIGLAGDIAEFLIIYAEIQLEPLMFQQAWHHPNPEDRKFWREAICLEFCKMIQNGVWRQVHQSQIPTN